MRRFFICAAILGAVCAAFIWRINQLETDLQTKELALQKTIQEVRELRIEADSALARAEGLAENARRCLAREAKAQADARERVLIMRQAEPRTRTEAEKSKVVDDATRQRVINRLNSGL